ncbi:MAG: CxxC-x17-CxxC domain-containing protein [Patescibacteria group bacterium]
MNNGKEEINFFGLTSFRNERKKFGIKTDDRRRHFYCIGKTGMGKSNLMENMAIQDIQKGNGVAYVDPHGEGAEKLLDFVPANRINDVVYFNPADLDYPIAFNVMEKVDFRYRHLVAGGLMGVFKKVWPDVWSARMEYILNNSILALLEYPDSTILGVNRMLADPEYRAKVVSKITDPIVKSFWLTEYARYTQRYEIEATAAIQNKVGQFISNPLIRNIIGQTKSTIDMRDIMDRQKIFIMDLSKGRIGEDNSRLVGALLITKLQLAAMSRVDIPEEQRKDFYLYVDEFQNFATESFANILSEARKYRLNITLGHQYIAQMEEEVRDAVFGNVGTLAVFRIGAEDAEFLEREFSPQFTAEDLVNLPKYNIYLKLMIDGVSGHPFSAITLPPPIPLENSNKEKIIKASRERYGVRKEIIEEKISRWSGFGENQEGAEEFKKPIKSNDSFKNFNPAKSSNPNMSAQAGHVENQTLYDAICSNCGKPTKVIFQPGEGRPVYCKSCLKKLKGEGQEKKVENISFNVHKNSTEEKTIPTNKHTKRKEINLDELRKALEESLEEKPDKSPEGHFDPLRQSFSEASGPATIPPKADLGGEEDDKKKVINPGETIKF